MNYKKLYNSIIQKRRAVFPIEYSELHHIVPSALGGTDDKENLVRLTAREHFICHYLLVKIQPKETIEYYKMLSAFMIMKAGSISGNRYFNSRLYENAKIQFSKAQSEKQTGRGNSRFGTIWIYHPTTHIVKSIKYQELYLYPDYIRGRGTKNKIQYGTYLDYTGATPERKKVSLLSLEKRKKSSEKAHSIYGEWQNSGLSITEFALFSKWNMSQPAMSRLMRKYVQEYKHRYKQSNQFGSHERS